MTLPENTESTSAEGAMWRNPLATPLLAGCLLAGMGTSSAYAWSGETMQIQRYEQTSAGAPVAPSENAGPAIGELRRLSGFTWEQLARLFNVNRRSLHFWASGKAMSVSNEEHLQRLQGAIRKIDRGSGDANRTALLAVQADGTIPFDLLCERRYDAVVTLLGPAETLRVRQPKPSAAAIAARAPRPPEELVGALQDRIHPSSGRLLGTKPLRVSRSK